MFDVQRFREHQADDQMEFWPEEEPQQSRWPFIIGIAVVIAVAVALFVI